MVINSNGYKKFLATVGATALASFLCFTGWWVFIRAPEVYATKGEVQSFRKEFREDLKYIRDRIDKALEGNHGTTGIQKSECPEESFY